MRRFRGRLAGGVGMLFVGPEQLLSRASVCVRVSPIGGMGVLALAHRLGRRWATTGLVFGTLATLLVLGVSAPASASFSWSEPVEIAPHDGQGPSPLFSEVACPTLDQCTVVNWDGDVATFDPTDPGTPTLVPMTAPLALGGGGGLSCPSATQCSVIDSGGREVTFDPSSPGRPMPVTVDTSGYLVWLACPTIQLCTGVDDHNHAVTFDPQHPVSRSIALEPGEHTVAGLACTSATQCTATDNKGAVTFDPVTSTVLTRITLGTGAYSGDRAIACPMSTQCTTVEEVQRNGSRLGGVTTFNPLTGNILSTTTVVAERALSAIACVNEHQCTVAGEIDEPITFDPLNPTTTIVGDVHSALAEHGGTLSEFAAIACPASTQCTALAQQPVTFDPQITATDASASEVVVDEVRTNGRLEAVACPSEAQCTAIEERGGEVTFDPTDPSATKTSVIDPSLVRSEGRMSDIACPAVTLCVAVGVAYETPSVHGQEVTFDPLDPGSPVVVTLVDRPLRSVSCPTVTQCTVLTEPLNLVELPTAPDELLTFDPSAPGASHSTLLGVEWVGGLSCPVLAQCTGVGLVKQASGPHACCGGRPLGGEVTFDPVNNGAQATTIVDRAWQAIGYCRFECNSSRLVNIVCVSAAQCTATDYGGRALTFDPTRPGTPVLMSIPAGTLACPAATECVKVGTEMSVGNPLSGARWRTERLDDESKSFSAVSCASPHQCVAVNEDGLTTVGTNAAPPTAPTRVKAVVVSKHVHGDTAAVTIDCFGRPTSACALALVLEAVGRPHSARHAARVAHRLVVVDGDQQAVVQISLNTAGRALLAARRTLAVRVTSTEHAVVRHWGTLTFKQRSQKRASHRAM
jgi:hypothetical protein